MFGGNLDLVKNVYLNETLDSSVPPDLVYTLEEAYVINNVSL